MALTIPCTTSRSIGLEEFIDHVRREVDLRDVDSIAEAALMLAALANDRDLVVNQLNRQMKGIFKGATVASAQVIFLGEGKNFYVRANAWPSTADIAAGRVYQDQFSYNVAHDHNYHFMTVGYFGPGYVTEIYEYEHDKVEGYPGEPVDFRFLERTHFASGRAMLYRASRDLHVQYPPEDLSITLNLMVETPEVRSRDQYFFDLERRTITNYPAESDGSRRVNVVTMAGLAGNSETCQLLTDLALRHPCRRTRLTAYESLAKLLPDDAARIWERATADASPLVVNQAHARLSVR